MKVKVRATLIAVVEVNVPDEDLEQYESVDDLIARSEEFDADVFAAFEEADPEVWTITKVD